ncbi:MAG: hypothetical protein MUP70_07460, partial [Candidatus Aminicenantes bacterium]|nr:hypothetical protein [Candidatus Aminicenantes bacterium]
NYIETFKMKLAAGRDFNRELSTDVNNYIINESLLRLTGLENPIGKMFSLWQYEGTIIGVVKDFHATSLHNEIRPLVLTLRNEWPIRNIFIRIQPEQMDRTLREIEGIWSGFFPLSPFNYRFMDDIFNEQYNDDRRTGTLFQYFAILAIFISCLGIFGLAAFMAEKRTKEIGIRKILGASIPKIIGLLSREFAVLVGVANLIAWPLAYFISQRLLQGYAYRTTVSLWIFAAATLTAFAVALFSVGYQALKSARADPADSLRYE